MSTPPANQVINPAGQLPWRHSHIVCPACTNPRIERVRRQGLWEYLLSVIYIYPFKCAECGNRFRALEWGIRYRRRKI